MLTAAEIATFHFRGFHLLPQVCDVNTVAMLNDDLSTVPFLERAWKGPWNAEGDTPSLLMRPLVHGRDVWRPVLSSPVIEDTVTQLIGPHVIDQSMAIVKPAEHGQMFPWHQDSAYYGAADHSWLIGTLYLDDATADNGPLQLIPGSHRQGRRPHQRINGKAVINSISATELVTLPAKAGDLILWDVHLVHGSQRNTSNQMRRTARIVWRAA